MKIIPLLSLIILSTNLSFSNDSELSLAELLSIKLKTGSFLELDQLNSSMSMTIINERQIKYSGARHLSELLEIYVPGFQYMYNKWNGIIWGMRGVAADRNTKFIFLINGHKMNHESRDGAMAEISLGMLGDVERVEVLRGPSGLVYGSGAIAGVVNIVTNQYEEDKTELNVKVGTWTLQTTNQEIQAQLANELNEDEEILVSLGYRESEGVGAEETRITGRAHWPFPQELRGAPENGLPSAGSAWSTPGNWKASVDYTKGNFSLYTRMTHQVSNAGGLFPLDAWPEAFGEPVLKENTLRLDTIINGENAPEEGVFLNSFVTQGNEGEDITNSVFVSAENSGNTSRSTALVDGIQQSIDAYGISSENWHTNRRQYVIDNIFVEAKYNYPIGLNEFQFKASIDAATNRIQREERKGYEFSRVEERNTFIEETFGEKRFGLGLMFLLQSIDDFDMAFGAEFRLDKIGDDLTGKNSQAEKANHPIVSEVDYYNTTLFFEGLYDISDKFSLHSGLRYDAHTRTYDLGGVLSPKMALIYKPNNNHSIKLIYQSSSNNGSADNYEYNRNNFDDNGKAYSDYHFEKPYELPGRNLPIAGVTVENLHSLVPEHSTSYELTSVHMFDEYLSILPSLSYNTIENLFTWSQPDFRIVNAGEYNFINAEIELKYNTELFDIGVNHTHQSLVNTEVKGQSKTYTGPEFDQDSNDSNGNPDWYEEKIDGQGNIYYVPKQTGTITQSINPILDQITVDGTNFLNLATDITKVYLNIKITDAMTFHTDNRIFWGLKGREDIHEYETNGDEVVNGGNENINTDDYKSIYGHNTDFNYHGIHKDIMSMWNASFHWNIEYDISIGEYVYDILADDEGGNAIHSLRWQQSGNSKEHTDLYGVDQRSYALSITKTF